MSIEQRLATLGLAGATSILVTLGGCADDWEEVPEGVACAGTAKASTPADLERRLAEAAPGSCVVVINHIDTASPIKVPQGVILVGSRGGPFSLTVMGFSGEAAVTLEDGAELGNVIIPHSEAVGVAIRAPRARLFDTRIVGVSSAALAVDCSGSGCEGGEVTLDDVKLEKSGYGLWARGGHVVMNGGVVEGSVGTAGSPPVGIVVTGTAFVETRGTHVHKSTGLGVLVRGPQARASLSGGYVNENRAGGIWFQELAGSLGSPALRVDAVEVARNRYVGIGGFGSRGIVITGSRVVDTFQGTLLTNRDDQVVGDGISLAGTTDVLVEGTHLEGNERAAALVDGAEGGQILFRGTVATRESALPVVVQDSTGRVEVAPEHRAPARDAASKLGIFASAVDVPDLLPAVEREAETARRAEGR